MVSSINNVQQNIFQPQFAQQQFTAMDTQEPPTSFESEDQAIISAEAKMQYDLEKFNSGGDNAVDLALSCVVAKNTVSAEVNVINAKKNMFDTILSLGD